MFLLEKTHFSKFSIKVNITSFDPRGFLGSMWTTLVIQIELYKIQDQDPPYQECLIEMIFFSKLDIFLRSATLGQPSKELDRAKILLYEH